jgi:hypothetical protein
VASATPRAIAILGWVLTILAISLGVLMFTPTRMAATRATAGHNWGIALSHDAVWLGLAQPAVMDGAGLLRLGCSVLAAGGVEGLGELLVERQARAFR